LRHAWRDGRPFAPHDPRLGKVYLLADDAEHVVQQHVPNLVLLQE
jgi:hypothetical protein